MINRRMIFICFLVLLPVLVCVGFGAHAIWITGHWKSLGWIFPGCWVAAWILARLWKRNDLVADVAKAMESDDGSRKHWNEQDHQAAKIIDRYQREFDSIEPSKLTDPHHYLSQAQALAVDLAKFYRDDSHSESSSAAIDSLTIVEVAAAARLAIEDLESWILKSIPGSRMITIRQWRAITSAPKWYSHASKVYWAASTLINPTNLIRYATSKAMLDPVMGQLQSEVIATLYLNFLRRVGFYLIEMNSGRLRGGAAAYGQTFADHALKGAMPTTPNDSPTSRASGPTDLKHRPLSIAVVGQTSSGKSSLINALVGTDAAKTDVLPETRSVTRYRYTFDNESDGPGSLTLLDTAGYEQTGASKQQAADTHQAAIHADMILLVIDGHLSARQADVSMLEQLDQHFSSHPNHRRPPTLVVMTHVDLIPPASIWQPPYDLESPVEAKEENIRGARDYAHEVFGDRIAGVACVCLRPPEKSTWGVAEDLVPQLMTHLDDGRRVSLVRIFENQVDRQKLRTLASQLKNLASDAFQAWLTARI